MAITNTSSTAVRLPTTNADGLRIWYGSDEATMGKGGEFEDGLGQAHVSEYHVTFSDVALGTSATAVYVLDFNVVFPSTAVIDKITFTTGTAWATDTTINFGMVKANETVPGTYTIISATGLVSGLTLASRDAAGETTDITPGGTFSGSLMGVQAGIGFNALVTTHWTGAAPTAGTGDLRIFWRDKAFTS